MTGERLAKLMKHGSYTLFLILLYVLQTTPDMLEINEVKPMLVVAGAISIAMFEGEFLGGIYGAFAGLLCDTAGYALFGYTGFMLCFLCIMVGLLVENLMQPSFFTHVFYVFAAMMLIHTISFIFIYGIWKLPSLERLYFRKVVYVSLFTAFLSPITYFSARFMNRKFGKILRRYVRV